MSKKEEVLELGTEGGGATIFRTSVGPGKWAFHLEGNSMFLGDNDDEVWRNWTTEPVKTFVEALRSIGKDDSWIIFYPISIHPDYGPTIWGLAQTAARALPAELRQAWKHNSDKWRHCCLQQK